MCMACEEMQLYYAYLDAMEAEEKRKAQPWQCEVTLIPADDKAPAPASKAKPGFVCDDPE